MKYEIKNQPFTVLTLHMEQGEGIKCQSGAMAWMSPGIHMETKTGGLGGMFKKAIVGESLALNHYTATQAGELTLAKHSPGDILAFNISQTPIIAQKTSFLASTEGVNMDVFLQHKAGTGFFGGEGFILQKLSGSGMAFIHACGDFNVVDLGPGQVLKVSTSNAVAWQDGVKYDIASIGIKNALFSGEGLFVTTLTGPGKVVIQSMTLNDLAMSLIPYLPTNNS